MHIAICTDCLLLLNRGSENDELQRSVDKVVSLPKQGTISFDEGGTRVAVRCGNTVPGKRSPSNNQREGRVTSADVVQQESTQNFYKNLVATSKFQAPEKGDTK